MILLTSNNLTGQAESTEKGILFGHRPTRTGTGRGEFGPADLARPKLRALRAAGCVEWRGYGLGRKSGANRWAESGEKPSAAGELFIHCRPLSGNEKETGFLCDLCASVVKGAFDRQRILTTEAQRAQRRAFCLATDSHGQGLDGGCLARPTRPGQSSARCVQPGVVEWRGYGLRRKMARIGVRGRGEEFSAAC